MAPKAKPPASASSVQLSVAIFDNADMFRHRGILIDNGSNSRILNLQGSAGNWRYEDRPAYDGTDERDIIELYELDAIERSRIKELRDVAANLKIKDGIQGWNCQSWVLDLIVKIDGDLIDISDERWEALKAKQDGLA